MGLVVVVVVVDLVGLCVDTDERGVGVAEELRRVWKMANVSAARPSCVTATSLNVSMVN